MNSLNQIEVPQKKQTALTEVVAEYMQKRFLEETREGPRALPDISVPFSMVCEADHIVSVVVAAYKNIVTIWNISRGNSRSIDTSLAFQEIKLPVVLADEEGRVLVWYLPDVVSRANQNAVWESITRLRADLDDSMKPSRSRSWRNDHKYFRPNADIKGAVDLSPAWFQQGRGEFSAAKPPPGSI
ncbi:hypothetical protein EDD15DRAFT_2372786 [Pisolithus albus]|nr:hypothetical protein EDD15DRAFT_2372786 [Pisolithus albus]